MNIKQKAIQGIIWSAIQSWGSQAISFIVFFLLARLLTPEDFGLVALANVFIAFMQIFLDQGFAQALIQRKELEPEHLDTAFWTNIITAIVLSLIGIIYADFIAIFFKHRELTPIIQVLCILFLINAFSSVQQSLLQREFNFKAIAIRHLFGMITSGIVGIFMALNGSGVWSLVGPKIVYELIGSFVLWSASNWRPKLRFSLTHFRELFNFGISLLLLNFISFFQGEADNFLIGYFLNPESLGYYAIAKKILQVVILLLVAAIDPVILPLFSRLKEDLEHVRKLFYQATRLASTIAFPTFIAMAILTPELITSLFGEKWIPAIPVIQIFCLAGIIQSIYFFKVNIVVAMGKPSWRLWQSLLSITLNFIGFAIAYRWGIIGLAIAYVIRRFLVFPLGQWQIDLLINISWSVYLRQFIAPFFSTGVMAIAVWTSKQMLSDLLIPQQLIVSCTLIGVAIYTLAIRILAPQLFNQLLELAKLVLSKSQISKQ